MHTFPDLLSCLLYLRPKTFGDGFAPYCESVLLPGSCTDVREPRKVKGFRLSFSALGPVGGCEPTELQKTGLLMMITSP